MSQITRARPKEMLASLDALLSDPIVAAQLERSEIIALLPQIAALVVNLTARLLALPPEAPAPSAPFESEEDRMISCAEAARLLGRSRRWLWRKQHELPFIRRVGRHLLCSKQGIREWLASKRLDG